MKKLTLVLALLAVVGMVVTGCKPEEKPAAPETPAAPSTNAPAK